TFADFECSHCKRLEHSLGPLRDRFSDRVRFVSKHYPLDQACNPHVQTQRHPNACLAATAAICSQDQGVWETFQETLFRNQKRLERKDLLFYAENLGMDVERFAGCLDGTAAAEQLREDISHGAYLELTGTPRTYVNGRLFKGAVSEAMLEAAIELELGEREAGEDGRIRTDRTVVVDEGLPDGPVAMVHVEMGSLDFWIDAVEASVDAQGRAVARAGVVPPNVSWAGARAACESAGKRLCSAAEWTTACQGAEAVDDDEDGSVIGDYIEGREYPYGQAWKPSHCHDTGDRDKSGALPAGIRGGCRTPEGVYDLTGNVQEGVGATADAAVLLGGAWYYEEKASCGRAYDTFGTGFANRTTGFRCCADADVPPADDAELVGGQALIGDGDDLPAFEGGALGGGRTGSVHLEGRVGVINFWASWCGPCRKELPALAALSERNPDLAILAINVDRDEAAARRFLGGQATPFPVLLDPDSALAGRFDVVSMPTTLLVDAGGRVVLRHEGWSEAAFADLESRIQEMQSGAD
ncbi:MAG: redoxin family protein, partial [Myxococcota bacterium]|nr:redoxin family protein [Myxococcota bacterium]